MSTQSTSFRSWGNFPT